MNRKLTATLLILAAVLANVGFTALGSIFNYPDVLDEPAGKVLASFREHEGAVRGWFLVLAFSPRCSLRSRSESVDCRRAAGDAHRGARRHRRGRRPGHRPAALAAPRPRLRVRRGEQQPRNRADARDTFTTVSNVLGTAIGETLGYVLTAAWTVLVVVALGRRYAGRWFQVLGVTSAALVFVGVFSPLGVSVVDTANFFGYVLWSGGSSPSGS